MSTLLTCFVSLICQILSNFLFIRLRSLLRKVNKQSRGGYVPNLGEIAGALKFSFSYGFSHNLPVKKLVSHPCSHSLFGCQCYYH